MNITTLIVLAWLFGVIELTKSQLIEAIDQDTKAELEDYDFGQMLLISDIDKFAMDARELVLRMLLREVHHGISTLLPRDMEDKIGGM